MNTGYNEVDLRLGRYVPSDWEHIEKHPLTLREITKPTPVVVGINWYSDFDTPIRQRDGRWWTGLKPKHLGYVRGGHCVCMPQNGKVDTWDWHEFYDQGNEGACVGFGSSRAMSLLNGKSYNARWLWDEAKMIDEFPDTNPGDQNGTTVRAAMDILRKMGHVAWQEAQDSLSFQDRDKLPPVQSEGISSNKWALNVDDVLACLQNPLYSKMGAIPFVNSWGSIYPWFVWVPCETWARLIKEDGEFTVMVDL